MNSPNDNGTGARGALSCRPLGVAQAARWSGIPERTLRHWAKTGRMRAHRDPDAPKLWRIERRELERVWQGGSK